MRNLKIIFFSKYASLWGIVFGCLRRWSQSTVASQGSEAGARNCQFQARSRSLRSATEWDGKL